MAQWFRVYTALAEDLGSVSSIHVELLKTTCNSSVRDAVPLTSTVSVLTP